MLRSLNCAINTNGVKQLQKTSVVTLHKCYGCSRADGGSSGAIVGIALVVLKS